MRNASFVEQARQRTLDFFQAYFIENNMEKMLSYFSKHSSFMGWGSKEIYPDYEAIAATAHERMTIPFFVDFDGISMETIQATENFCIVLFTANITYHTDSGTPVRELERATFVYRKEQGEPKIVYLHSSAANKLHDLGKILPLEHGAEVTRRLTQLECDRSMAIDMCEHTPNGLAYCSIAEHYPLIYANQTLCQLLDCKDFTELMEYCKGEMERTVYYGDWDRMQRVLLSHTGNTPYAITYRMVTKQGQLRWVMERGQYIADGDTGEEYFIATIIPLELEQNDFSYGNLIDQGYIENAPISVGLFLQQTLDYNNFKDRPTSCQRLIEHCCETLQATGAILYSLKDSEQRITPVYWFDKLKMFGTPILSHFSWSVIASYFDEDGFSICTDLNNVPKSNFHSTDKNFMRSGISKVITIQGQAQYLLTVYHRGKPHTWTENEQDIVLQTSKLFSLLLDEAF